MAVEALLRGLTAYGSTLSALSPACRLADQAVEDQELDWAVHGTCCNYVSSAASARDYIKVAAHEQRFG